MLTAKWAVRSVITKLGHNFIRHIARIWAQTSRFAPGVAQARGRRSQKIPQKHRWKPPEAGVTDGQCPLLPVLACASSFYFERNVKAWDPRPPLLHEENGNIDGYGNDHYHLSEKRRRDVYISKLNRIKFEVVCTSGLDRKKASSFAFAQTLRNFCKLRRFLGVVIMPCSKKIYLQVHLPYNNLNRGFQNFITIFCEGCSKKWPVRSHALRTFMNWGSLQMTARASSDSKQQLYWNLRACG